MTTERHTGTKIVEIWAKTTTKRHNVTSKIQTKKKLHYNYKEMHIFAEGPIVS